MTEAVVPEPLLDWAYLTLDHATGSLQATGGTLTPFVIVQDDEGKRGLKRVVSDRMEDAAHQAQNLYRNATAEFAAVAYDGYVTLEGTRSEAVIVEARVSGAASLVLAQRYTREGFRKRRIVLTGNAALLDLTQPDR